MAVDFIMGASNFFIELKVANRAPKYDKVGIFIDRLPAGVWPVTLA